MTIRFNLHAAAISLTAICLAGVVVTATADDDGTAMLLPGSLIVSRSVYDSKATSLSVGQQLPPGCAPANCVQAAYDASYPFVWNNAPIDGSFGITSPIFLDLMTAWGRVLGSIAVPTDEMVSSFSSKSELALNLSTDGRILTFMGYKAPLGAIDVSNSNTPGVVDPTNPVVGSYFRLVAEVDRRGHFEFTETNAYSGNNGRAAIENVGKNASFFYTSGNAGNGANPQPTGIILAAGAQILTPQEKQESAQNPGTPTPLGSFNITQINPPNTKPDKIGKDDNFRGLTLYNNVVYYTKGSGGNGINTVYFVDSTGTVCTNTNGVGLPASGAALPTIPLAYSSADLIAGDGLVPSNMCVLKGFPTTLAKNATMFPFGLWFADATTLYVADEGDGTFSNTGGANPYTHASQQTTAGLQKWAFQNGQWNLLYALQNGLDLGVPYAIANGPGGAVYPTGPNPGNKNLPWTPATDGLRNITGRVNHDGTVTIYAITSTVSGNGDQGADPNRLVAITDSLSATGLPAGEKFTLLRQAGYGEVLRGVSFAPFTFGDDNHDR